MMLFEAGRFALKMVLDVSRLYGCNFQLCVCVCLVKAAKIRWPELFENVDLAMEDWLVDQMYTVRDLRSFLLSYFNL